MAKYRLSDETKEVYDPSRGHSVTVTQIIASETFDTVAGVTIHAGDKGGWIESESNLSQDEECWITDNVIVMGKASVQEGAYISHDGYANMSAKISDNTQIYGNAVVVNAHNINGHAQIYGNAYVEKAFVNNHAQVFGYAHIEGCEVTGNAKVYDFAHVVAENFGEIRIDGNAEVFGFAIITAENSNEGFPIIEGNSKIYDHAVITDNECGSAPRVSGNSEICGKANISGDFHINNVRIDNNDKIICVINGKGGADKDTLIEALSNETSVCNVSSIDPFKDIAHEIIGGEPKDKTPAYRKMLSELKSTIDEYYMAECGISYSNDYLKGYLYDFVQSGDNVMFVHIREPENITAFMDMAKRELMLMGDKTTQLTSLLVTSDRELDSYGNKSDDNIANYEYTKVYQSKGDKREDARSFKDFFVSQMIGTPA